MDNASGSQKTCINDVLPSELLAHIFSAGTVQWRGSTSDYLHPFPLLVDKVCSNWRLASHRTPELWNVISPPLNALKTPERAQEWATQWIRRSGDLPLTIVLHNASSPNGGFNLDIKAVELALKLVLQAALPHRARLRRLDIRLFRHGQAIPMVFLLDFLENQSLFPLLDEIAVHGIIGQNHQEGLQSRLDALPTLRKFSWKGFIPPRIQNITTLSVLHFNPIMTEVHAFFASCTNIQTLDLAEMYSMPWELTSSPPITLPSLTSLSLSLAPQPLTDIYPFSFLKLPNLIHLQLEGVMKISTVFRDSLEGCKLDTIRLSNRPIGSTREDQLFLRTLLREVKTLELIQSAAEDVLTDDFIEPPRPSLIRKHSISGLSRPMNTLHLSNTPLDPPPPVYRHLKTIVVDTVFAQELLHVCRFINLHRQVELLQLSFRTRRHLSASLQRNGNIISQTPTLMTKKAHQISGTNDVEDWLSNIVQIETLQPSSGPLEGLKFKDQPVRLV